MKLTPAKANKIIWVSAAAIFVVAALTFAVTYFIKIHETSNRQECQSILDGFQHRGELDELTAQDADCIELSR